MQQMLVLCLSLQQMCDGGAVCVQTTLMDVLAGRKTQGVLHGELTVNGHAKVQETWARVVGYVEQTDVHSGAPAARTARCTHSTCSVYRTRCDIRPLLRRVNEEHAC